MSAESRHHAAVMARDGGCMVGRLLEDREGCDGRLQAAHVPPKSSTKAARRKAVWRLKRGDALPDDLLALAELDEDDLVADGALGLALCKAHHRRWDLLGERLPRALLPAHVERRCAELGLTRLLDELLGPLPGEPDLRPVALRAAPPDTPEAR